MPRKRVEQTPATDAPTPSPSRRRRRRASGSTDGDAAPATPPASTRAPVTHAEANAAADEAEAGGFTPPDGPADPAPQGTAPEPPRSPFAKAPHQSGGFRSAPDLKNGFDVITKELFADGYDPVVEWKAISEALEIHGALTPGNIQAAANKQERIADRAFRLFIVAKREYATYMRETEPIVGAIREAAIAKLEIEKRTMLEVADGEDRSGNPKIKRVPLRTKQITDADVAGACAHYYGDEWTDVNDKRDRAEGMLKQIENLAGLARSRAYTASSLLSPGGRRVSG